MSAIKVLQPAPAGPGTLGVAVPMADSAPGVIRSAWNNARAIAGVVILEIYRRKDFYVLFVLTALITLLMGSVNFFNEAKTVRYLKEICLFLIWVSSLVIAITTTARQIPNEREHRTIFPLLAKPVTRNDLVLGKFLGCWLASGLALVVFYFFFSIICGVREHDWPLINYFQALVLHWFMLGVVVSMTLLGSIVCAAPSSTNTITFILVSAILLLARHLNKVALQLDSWSQTIVYSIYYIIPHLEIFDVRDLLIHNGELVPWTIWAGGLAYAAVYTTIFLVLTCLMFRRKAVN